MTASNLWAECAATYLRTRTAHGEHELVKAELRAKRAKSGAISFDPVEMESVHASGQ